MPEFKSFWKPEKTGPKPKKYIKTKVDSAWAKTRRLYLAGKRNHAGYYACESCGRYTKEIEVHHKISRGARKDLKHDPNNLTAICSPCHGKQHGQNRGL